MKEYRCVRMHFRLCRFADLCGWLPIEQHGCVSMHLGVLSDGLFVAKGGCTGDCFAPIACTRPTHSRTTYICCEQAAAAVSRAESRRLRTLLWLRMDNCGSAFSLETLHMPHDLTNPSHPQCWPLLILTLCLPSHLHRQRRLAELRAAASTPRFGTVEDIRGSEFVQKVSEASASGTWVVVLLHKEHSAGCQLLGSCLAELARSYPETKFVRIVSTDCIPSYPDRNLPTLLLYHNGACKQHLVGAAMYGGAAMTPERVALVLNSHGQVGWVEEGMMRGIVSLAVCGCPATFEVTDMCNVHSEACKQHLVCAAMYGGVQQ